MTDRIRPKTHARTHAQSIMTSLHDTLYVVQPVSDTLSNFLPAVICSRRKVNIPLTRRRRQDETRQFRRVGSGGVNGEIVNKSAM